MENNLNEALAAQIKDLHSVVENKINKGIEEAKLTGKEYTETATELKNAVEALKNAEAKMQEQLDAQSTELAKMKSMETAPTKSADPIRSLIKENFAAISGVRKGHGVKLSKAVGDMTLTGNLTGDQPRTFSNDVALVPAQALNLADLVRVINIGNGTYTFPREGAGEGSISAQTEGSAKSQRDYDITMVDVNTDFIAGFAVYSRKMANNLPFLESYLPGALRRDYAKAENSAFNTVLAAAATASAQVITSKNKVEMLINEVATLEGVDFMANGIVVRPSDFYDILKTEKSTGAGYGLPGVVTFVNGQLFINGIPVYRANWMAANKYYVGDWTNLAKVVTEGLSVEFSESDSDNFRKNNITARVEAQVALAVERPDAVIYGDFTAV